MQATKEPRRSMPVKDFSELKRLLESSQKEFENARKTYEAFKALRALMGKPVVTGIDPVKIRKDLSGRDFFRPP